MIEQQTSIRRGQVWQSNDKRDGGRVVRVLDFSVRDHRRRVRPHNGRQYATHARGGASQKGRRAVGAGWPGVLQHRPGPLSARLQRVHSGGGVRMRTIGHEDGQPPIPDEWPRRGEGGIQTELSGGPIPPR